MPDLTEPINLADAPEWISVSSDGVVVGYVKKADLYSSPDSPSDTHIGEPIPVYDNQGSQIGVLGANGFVPTVDNRAWPCAQNCLVDPRSFCAGDRACAGAPHRALCVLASEEVVEGMPFVTCHMSISLDGFVAGPRQSADNPLGIDGRKLHDWHLNEPKHPVDEAFTQRLLGPRGAYIMGRNMFGPVRGEWGDSDWRGWWGPEPPYHAPVFVLTHHPHDPINMEAGTTFYFVDGFETALADAAKHADNRPIDIAGGASAVRQALQARCLNELVLDIVPVVLGDGERIFDDVPEFHAKAVEAATSPLATHIVYKIT